MAKKSLRKTTGKKVEFPGANTGRACASKALGPSTPKRAAAGSAACGSIVMPTREQISARARAIWEAKGCVQGQDEQNWQEAEAQLRAELIIA